MSCTPQLREAAGWLLGATLASVVALGACESGSGDNDGAISQAAPVQSGPNRDSTDTPESPSSDEIAAPDAPSSDEIAARDAPSSDEVDAEQELAGPDGDSGVLSHPVLFDDLVSGGVQIPVTDPDGLAEEVIMFLVSPAQEEESINLELIEHGHVVLDNWGGYDVVHLYRDAFCGVAPAVSLGLVSDGQELHVSTVQAEITGDCEAAERGLGIGINLRDPGRELKLSASFVPHTFVG